MKQPLKSLYKVCSCGEVMEEVINYQTPPNAEIPIPTRKGWYCVACKHWEKAIARETKVQ